MFLSILGVGQSVPDTDSFSLQDVVNVVGGSSLSDAFSNANQNYFDLTFGNGKLAPNSLIEFRNYGSHNDNSCQCPDGYTNTGEGCYIIETVAAIPPTDPEIIVAERLSDYGWRGTIIYNNYNSSGVGTVNRFLTSSWWKNTNTLVTEGPLNRTGTWAETTLSNQEFGYSRSIDIPSAKTYYVGVGCDNYATIKINGSEILSQDIAAINTSLRDQGIISSSQGDKITWQLWMIYPVYLNAGENVIEVIGNNISGGASLGLEIYDATATELEAVTSYSDLGNDLIFSTKDVIGEPVQLGTGGTGYSCPDGYSLVQENGETYCARITHIECGETPLAANTGIVPISSEIEQSVQLDDHNGFSNEALASEFVVDLSYTMNMTDSIVNVTWEAKLQSGVASQILNVYVSYTNHEGTGVVNDKITINAGDAYGYKDMGYVRNLLFEEEYEANCQFNINKAHDGYSLGNNQISTTITSR